MKGISGVDQVPTSEQLPRYARIPSVLGFWDGSKTGAEVQALWSGDPNHRGMSTFTICVKREHGVFRVVTVDPA